jgi:hypothetical protein
MMLRAVLLHRAYRLMIKISILNGGFYNKRQCIIRTVGISYLIFKDIDIKSLILAEQTI